MIPFNMRTGRQTTVSPAADDLDPQTVTKIKIILNRYMVHAVKDAAEYCHTAGRNTLTATDIEYALKYQAHEFVIDDALLTECEQEFEDTQNSTKPTRTLWADEVETDDEEEDDEEDDEEEDLEVDDDEEPFTRCTDTSNEKIVKMNRYYDEWDGWIPDTDLHKSVKNSIDKTFGGV